MNSPEKPVDQVLVNYRIAIDWAKLLVRDLSPQSRVYEYLKVLDETVQANETGNIVIHPTLLILEAAQHSNFLIELHKKFENRTDDQFIKNLRFSLLGPVLSHEEIMGEGRLKNSNARDIESELLLATRIKNNAIVSFEGSDVVYDLKEYKFGAEVKRIHSLDQIKNRFLKGCEQIQKNKNIKYGIVVFRFDKYFYLKEQTGLRLIERGENILNFETWGECVRYATIQNFLFKEKHGEELLELARSYSKVVGMGVYCLLPGMIKYSNIPFITGQFTYCYFGACGKDSEPVILRFAQELDDMESGN